MAALQPTKLFTASQNGQLDVVIQLLQQGCDPNQYVSPQNYSNALHTNTFGTPLYISAKNGHIHVVRALLSAGALPNVAVESGDTAIHQAAVQGDDKMLQDLINAGADVNSCSSDSASPLLLAAECGHLTVTHLLLQSNASIDQRRDDGATPLLMASVNGHIAIVNLLVKAGADTGACNVNGATPLIVAIAGKYIDVVRLLLQYCGPEDFQGQDVSPIDAACSVEDDHVRSDLLWLLQQKARELNLLDNSIPTPSPITNSRAASPASSDQLFQSPRSHCTPEPSYRSLQLDQNDHNEGNLPSLESVSCAPEGVRVGNVSGGRRSGGQQKQIPLQSSQINAKVAANTATSQMNSAASMNSKRIYSDPSSNTLSNKPPQSRNATRQHQTCVLSPRIETLSQPKRTHTRPRRDMTARSDAQGRVTQRSPAGPRYARSTDCASSRHRSPALSPSRMSVRSGSRPTNSARSTSQSTRGRGLGRDSAHAKEHPSSTRLSSLDQQLENESVSSSVRGSRGAGRLHSEYVTPVPIRQMSSAAMSKTATASHPATQHQKYDPSLWSVSSNPLTNSTSVATYLDPPAPFPQLPMLGTTGSMTIIHQEQVTSTYDTAAPPAALSPSEVSPSRGAPRSGSTTTSGIDQSREREIGEKIRQYQANNVVGGTQSRSVETLGRGTGAGWRGSGRSGSSSSARVTPAESPMVKQKGMGGSGAAQKHPPWRGGGNSGGGGVKVVGQGVGRGRQKNADEEEERGKNLQGEGMDYSEIGPSSAEGPVQGVFTGESGTSSTNVYPFQRYLQTNPYFKTNESEIEVPPDSSRQPKGPPGKPQPQAKSQAAGSTQGSAMHSARASSRSSTLHSAGHERSAAPKPAQRPATTRSGSQGGKAPTVMSTRATSAGSTGAGTHSARTGLVPTELQQSPVSFLAPTGIPPLSRGSSRAAATPGPPMKLTRPNNPDAIPAAYPRPPASQSSHQPPLSTTPPMSSVLGNTPAVDFIWPHLTSIFSEWTMHSQASQMTSQQPPPSNRPLGSAIMSNTKLSLASTTGETGVSVPGGCVPFSVGLSVVRNLLFLLHTWQVTRGNKSTPLYKAAKTGDVSAVRGLLAAANEPPKGFAGQGGAGEGGSRSSGPSTVSPVGMVSGTREPPSESVIDYQSAASAQMPTTQYAESSKSGVGGSVGGLRDSASSLVQSSDVMAPLLIAAYRGHLDVVKELVQVGLGMDVGKSKKGGGSSGQCAPSIRAHYGVAGKGAGGKNRNEIQKFLVDATQVSTLQEAASLGLMNKAQAILQASIQADDVDLNNVYIASTVATQHGHQELSTLLRRVLAEQANRLMLLQCQQGEPLDLDEFIKFGANVNVQDSFGRTPLYHASVTGEINSAIVLVNAGSDVDTPARDGMTPLLAAAANLHVAIAQLLVRAGAYIQASDEQGRTAFSVLQEGTGDEVQEGKKEQIRQFLEQAAGVTALSQAASLGLQADVERYMQNVHEVSDDVKLALSAAQNAGHEGVVQLIKGKMEAGEALLEASAYGDVDTVQKHINNGADIEWRSYLQQRPLYVAARSGHSKVVRVLARAGAEINASRESGITPLIIACFNGHVNVVKVLLQFTANVDLCMEDGVTPLIAAAHNNHCDIVDLLILNNANINVVQVDGISALYVAAQNNHKEVCRLLIKSGAQCNLTRRDGMTPLYIAAEAGLVGIVKVLLTDGKDVNVNGGGAGWSGVSPLLIASENGHVEVVRQLLARGASVNTRVKYGFTPLIIASQNGHGEVVKQLIQSGADVGEASDEGMTPLMVASAMGHLHVVKILVQICEKVGGKGLGGKSGNLASSLAGSRVGGKNRVQIQQFLKEASKASTLRDAARLGLVPQVKQYVKTLADIEGQEGKAALDIAQKQGHTAVVQILTEVQASKGKAPQQISLLEAAWRGDVTAVRGCLQRGASLNDTDTMLRTPLHWSAYCGHVDVVQELIQAGALLDPTMEGGGTPLHAASINGHLPVVRVLVAAGANAQLLDGCGRTAADVAGDGVGGRGREAIVKVLVKYEKGGTGGEGLAAVAGKGVVVLNSSKAEGVNNPLSVDAYWD